MTYSLEKSRGLQLSPRLAESVGRVSWRSSHSGRSMLLCTCIKLVSSKYSTMPFR